MQLIACIPIGELLASSSVSNFEHLPKPAVNYNRVYILSTLALLPGVLFFTIVLHLNCLCMQCYLFRYLLSIYDKLSTNMRSFEDMVKKTIQGNYVDSYGLPAEIFSSHSHGSSTYIRNTLLTSYKEIQHIKQDFYDIRFSRYYRGHS